MIDNDDGRTGRRPFDGGGKTASMDDDDTNRDTTGAHAIGQTADVERNTTQ